MRKNRGWMGISLTGVVSAQATQTPTGAEAAKGVDDVGRNPFERVRVLLVSPRAGIANTNRGGGIN